MSFRLKTIIGIASIEIVLLSLLVFSSMQFLESSNEVQLLNRAQTSSHLLAMMSTDAVVSMDLATIDELLEKTLTTHDITYIRVRHSNGFVLSEKGDAVALKRDFKADITIQDAVSDQIYDVAHDITVAGETFGRIELGMSTKTLEALLEKASKRMFVVALFEIVLVGIFGFVLGGMLTRQLTSLQLGAREVADGNLGHTIFVHGKDELAETAHSFNEMSLSLKKYALELEVAKEHADEKRLRAETILEGAVQSLMQGVIIVDADCNILHMNKAFLDMYGIDPDEQLNLLNIKDVREVIGMGNPPLLVCNPDVSQMEMPITKLSDKKSILHSYKPLSVGGGVWVDTDVSQIIDAEERNKKLEYDLLQSQKMESIGTLAGGIAHEINTPTQYISDNLKFLSDANEDLASIIRKWRIMTEKAQEHDVLAELAKKIETLCNEVDLDFILKEIPDAISQSRSGLAHVSKIVLAMKDFSHPGTADKSSFDINRAIETAITISRNQWKDVAEVNVDLDQNLLMAECHADQLNQVFLNLIVNASHAIESVEGRSEPGLIKLSTRLIDNQIVISVEDNGIGIPDTVINKIFDPFFTTKEVGRGTGQGLSIAYDIVVNKHAGTLQVASEIGKGTTFTIGLPVHESRVQKNPNTDLTERGDDIGTNP